jgi:pilus assembly protein CpaC
MNTVITCMGGIRAGLLALIFALPAAVNAADASFTLGIDGGESIQELTLPVGKSQIIRSATALQQLIVGNPEIADVQLLGESQFLVLGKQPGTTNVAFWDNSSNIIAIIDVVVGYDLDAIKRKLNEILPDELQIEVRTSNGNVLLSGQISSPAALNTVMAITDSYAADQVVNLLQVGGGQQVLLEARIVEIKRNRMQELGFQTDIIGTAGSETAFRLLTGIPLRNAFGNGVSVVDTSLGKQLGFNLQALEREGAAQVLAEPNIVAMSGEEASFLVGGEFPVPIAQGGAAMAGALTIEWKEFGVGLRFTPTVLSSKRINLRLDTEVSDIDYTTGTTVLGTTVPGLRTRRASTTIELGDGSSFAIAGLLQNDIGSLVRQFPGLGNLPILGALFRSNEFQRQETELVIVMTPRLVQSVAPGDVRMPESLRLPSNWDLYGMGRSEAPNRSGSTQQGGAVGANSDRGLDGVQGHQF